MVQTKSKSLDRDGFLIVRSMLERAQVMHLSSALTDPFEDGTTNDRGLYARRNLLGVPIIRELAQNSAICDLVAPWLGHGAKAVRGIFFDKTPAANWKVAWHQDLSVAVREKIDAAGFEPWSVKAGVVHVQPPLAILERMLTVRVHLDDCGDDNGPLRVVAGSHLRGVLSPAEVRGLAQAGPIETCLIPAGGALLMRPLLLHSSSSAERAGHRRVIHLEFAAEDLPGGLQWHAG